MNGINEPSKTNDSGSMLIIVKNGNIHQALQFFLNIETVWSFDIFQVDPAEGRR